MIENFGYRSSVGLTLIKKADVAKHLQGRHNQKTHAGGMSNVWAKGQWHQMSDKDYVGFISESYRLAREKSEKRVITKTEWNRDYASSDEGYLKNKPTRVYKNGNILVYSKQSNSPHHTAVNEGSFMRDVDDLQEKYPLPHLVIRIGDDIDDVAKPDAFGAAVRGGEGGRLMWIRGDGLNPNQMREGSWGMEAQFKTGVRTYVLTHEWGHAIDKPQEQNDNLIKDLLSRNYRLLDDEVEGTELMSGYGNTSPSEAFAEAFLDYVVGQDRGQPSRNRLVNTMAETFGWDKPWKK